jgi:hypothetical protein
MENARFSPPIGYSGPWDYGSTIVAKAVAELGRATAWEQFAANSV